MPAQHIAMFSAFTFAIALLAACGPASNDGMDVADTSAETTDASDLVDQADQGPDAMDGATDQDVQADSSGDSWQDTGRDGADAVDPGSLRNTYRFEDPEAYPESVVWDPVGRAFYTGSLATGAVTRMSVDGEETTFFAGNTQAPEEWLLMGLEVDVDRRHLWVCANLGRDFQRGEAWLLDLESGERLWQADLEEAASGGTCADVVVDEGGIAWIADRMAGNIYRLNPQARTVELVVSDPLLEPDTVGQNGIAFTPDGDLLTVKFAPLQLMHITFREDMAPLVQEVELTNEGDTSLSGGGDALVVHNGLAWIVTDSQLLRITPDGLGANDLWTSAHYSIHVLGLPDGGELTGVSGLTVVEDAFYVAKSEVFKFALQLSPELPFLLQRVETSVFK